MIGVHGNGLTVCGPARSPLISTDFCSAAPHHDARDAALDGHRDLLSGRLRARLRVDDAGAGDAPFRGVERYVRDRDTTRGGGLTASTGTTHTRSLCPRTTPRVSRAHRFPCTHRRSPRSSKTASQDVYHDSRHARQRCRKRTGPAHSPDNSRSLPYPFIFHFYSCVYGLAFSRTVYGHPLFVGGNR